MTGFATAMPLALIVCLAVSQIALMVGHRAVIHSAAQLASRAAAQRGAGPSVGTQRALAVLIAHGVSANDARISWQRRRLGSTTVISARIEVPVHVWISGGRMTVASTASSVDENLL